MVLEAKDAMSVVATLSTIALLLTGIQICMKIRRQGNTTNVSIFPFLASDISCVIWLKYGILKEDTALIIVNAAGVILQSIYILIFYIHDFEKVAVHRKLSFAGLFIFPVLIYIKFFVDDIGTALGHLGLIGCCCSVVMYGSPLSTLADVIRTQSTASMAFPLSLANFLVALEWAVYGHIITDNFVKIPNIIGALLGFFQVMLFYCYSGSPSTGNQPVGQVRNV
ncbi:sugar transporter SWEET1-like [Acanthaster planci]|uniref:Sugar transporter SWEET n=1 Tax=Acanthaster planci TaxID=133434 RepID=A0A8B7Y217_ACAPL|nr:sugar transporter SWEET1-like [Acanthaster planci]XP_022085990.1 sugar transporter SWEET1-like [Acanthaster planci]XP_022085998.1 sugar transporter SWEET1-like [Acanthaster planci]